MSENPNKNKYWLMAGVVFLLVDYYVQFFTGHYWIDHGLPFWNNMSAALDAFLSR